ncbi:MAG: SCO family protein [Sphingomonadales bacterium]|nr:SCO family protein [Sphingomonadales bacterium]
MKIQYIRGKLKLPFKLMTSIQILSVLTSMSASLYTGCRSKENSNHNTSSSKSLPIFGPMEIVETKDGMTDTVFRELPNISLEDQYGVPFHNDSLKGQIQVMDFFFASCPGICIDMSRHMAALYAQEQKKSSGIIGNRPRSIGVRFVSYTIDPQRDTRDVLAEYAQKHGVRPPSRQWLLLRGKEEEIHHLARQYYLLSAGPDSAAPGGFLHSGQFLLIDPRGRIRGLYDGTNWAECKVLESDLALLQKEFSYTD